MRRPSSLAVVTTLFALLLVAVIVTFVVVAIDSNSNPRPGTTVTLPVSAPPAGG